MTVNKLQFIIQVFFQLLLWAGIIAAFLLQVAVSQYLQWAEAFV